MYLKSRARLLPPLRRARRQQREQQPIPVESVQAEDRRHTAIIPAAKPFRAVRRRLGGALDARRTCQVRPGRDGTRTAYGKPGSAEPSEASEKSPAKLRRRTSTRAPVAVNATPATG